MFSEILKLSITQNKKEWINVLLCSFPLIAMGVYGGGESQNAIYLLGLYNIFLLTYGIFKKREIKVKKNIFLLSLIVLTAGFLISALFSVSFFISIDGFLEYLAYFTFFMSLVILKPEKEKLLYIIFVFVFFEMFYAFTGVGKGRLEGTYKYANYFTIPLFFGFLFCFYKIKRIVVKVPLLLLFITAAVLTGSRIVFVFILILPFILFKRKILWLIAPAFVVMLLLIPNPIQKRIRGKIKVYSLQRPNIWKQSMKTGLQRPITGWGLRNFEKSVLKFSFPVRGKYERRARIAHNQFLQYFTEGGLILLFSYIFLFYVFLLNYKNLGKLEKVFIILIFVHSLVDNPLYLPANFLLFLSVLYTGASLNKNYSVILSKPVKYLIPLMALIYILPLTSVYAGNIARNNYKKGNYIEAFHEFSLAESLWGLPRYAVALARVQEQIFIQTGNLGCLHLSYYYYNSAMNEDPLNWKIPLRTYEFLQRNKQNAGVDKPLNLLKRAIELNPYERELHKILIDEYKKEGKYRQSRLAECRMKKIFDITTQKIH